MSTPCSFVICCSYCIRSFRSFSQQAQSVGSSPWSSIDNLRTQMIVINQTSLEFWNATAQFWRKASKATVNSKRLSYKSHLIWKTVSLARVQAMATSVPVKTQYYKHGLISLTERRNLVLFSIDALPLDNTMEKCIAGLSNFKQQPFTPSAFVKPVSVSFQQTNGTTSTHAYVLALKSAKLCKGVGI